MKKITTFLGRLLALSILAAPFAVRADSFLDDDLNYLFESGSETRVQVYLRNRSATHITIPSTVVYEYTDYNDRDDNGNAKLKRRTCTVTSIGGNAFHICSGLTSVTIPGSVTSIGDRAFYGCSGLTNVTIPDSVTSIGYEAFRGCSGLTSVTIPDSVASIGAYAFYGCSGLTSVTIPDSVTSIRDWTFGGCSGLTSVTIPDSVTSISKDAFYNCSGLTSVTIPDSVTNIGEYAFYNCSGLTSVTIPDSVTSIGSSTFSGCSGLTSVTIGNGVTGISGAAFYNCSGLSNVWIGSGATDINYTAFNLCENLQRFIVDAENPAYASPDGALCSKDLKTLVVYPRGRTDARLPDSLVAAMPDAFAGCNKLWMEWCKRINTIPYDLTQTPGDRAIADVAVNGDMALDAFVLKEGKVYDSVLYVHNYADHAVKVTLPSIPMTEYKTFKGATPLTLPAYSTSILTITRVAGGNAGGNVFLVSREELETVQ